MSTAIRLYRIRLSDQALSRADAYVHALSDNLLARRASCALYLNPLNPRRAPTATRSSVALPRLFRRCPKIRKSSL
eukprot:1335572-Pleurochrysis_carterae.AAC.2